MDIMSAKVEKDMRNSINRKVNCDSANADKTVAAAQEQLERIRRIEREVGIENLPDTLQEAALLRITNPEASLSDLARLAMSKKKHKVIDAERVAFVRGDPARGIAGAVANGVPEAVANSIYDEILDFASYAFNKAHAVAYAIVAYRTAWMKYRYPREYMSRRWKSSWPTTPNRPRPSGSTRTSRISMRSPGTVFPWIGHPVSGLWPLTARAVNTRFPFGSATELLNLASDYNSPDHSTKGTLSRINAL